MELDLLEHCGLKPFREQLIEISKQKFLHKDKQVHVGILVATLAVTVILQA